MRRRVESGDIGYIRIEQFIETTADGSKERWRAGARSAFKGYIIDLRNNSGGYEDETVDTVNTFVNKGEIVATNGREPGANSVFFALPGRDLSKGEPLVVLVNGGTASAAEIAAGACRTLGAPDAVDNPSRRRHFAADDDALLQASRAIDSGEAHRSRHRNSPNCLRRG
jgi:C-terminal processing protease CtpA/Prc